MGILSVAQPEAMAPAVAAAQLFRNAELCLLSGHTSAREVAGADGGLRQAIDAGLVAGPRLFPSGPALCQSGGHGDLGPAFLPHQHDPDVPGLAQMSIVCDGPDQVRVAARTAFRRGATQLKVIISGGVVSLTDRLEDTQWRCCTCGDRAWRRQTVAMRTRRPRPPAIARPAFAGFCFPPDVIVLAVRWYLRFALSYRDVEELLAERGLDVDHVTIYRWVQRFTPLLADAARPCRHAVGNRWQVDETYVKVAGRWRYVYRAIDQFGQVIDVFVSPSRDASAARRFFERAIGTTAIVPVEVVTDQAAVYPAVLDELLPAAWHRTERHANNHVEADHGRLKARLRPMRGLKQDRSARVIIAGHAFVQNLRRAHYELAVEEPVTLRLAVAFDELALAI
jgi:transposase-like protein